MPIFTAAAGAIVSAIAPTLVAGGTGFFIAQTAVAAGLAAGTGHLLGVFDDPGVGSVEDQGVNLRLPANTTNRVPILYGSWQTRGIITYAEISDDRQTLRTVLTLGEGPASSITTIQWQDLTLTIDSDGDVTGATDIDGNDVDRLNGLINVQTYLGDTTSNFSDYLDNASDTWGDAHKMTELVYAVVTVTYNRDAQVTGLADMRFTGTSAINDPADAVKDLLTNSRYGLDLPDAAIDTTSFDAATTYFEELLDYTDADGDTQTAARFQVNGSIATSTTVRRRIESILIGSNSSLRWSNGQYGIFVNKADTVHSFTMNEDRVIGGIEVTESGFNSLLNRLVVNYGRDAANNYQPNTVIIETPAANLHPNEPVRERTISLPLVATAVEAQRVGTIILNQSREQLRIQHRADITCLPLEAGDVIQYSLDDYGWTDKQFRITSISEIEEGGAIEFQITAIEYTADVYTDLTFIEPGASPNVNLPGVEEIAEVDDLSIAEENPNESPPNFVLEWTVPDNALIEAFDIFANRVSTTFSNSATFRVTEIRSSGSSYTAGAGVSVDIATLPAGTYTLWVVGRNSFATSDPSNAVTLSEWTPSSVEGATRVIRHHENNVTSDPSAPTGTDGTGGGWYDPTDDSSTNFPTGDPDPHWEATGVGVSIGGTTRRVRFDISGSAGDTSITTTAENQEHTFAFTGTAGEETALPEQAEILGLTFSGEAAETNGGEQTYWRVTVGGTSPDTNITLIYRSTIYMLEITGAADGPAIAQAMVTALNSSTVPVTAYIDHADGHAVSRVVNPDILSSTLTTSGSGTFSSTTDFYVDGGTYSRLDDSGLLSDVEVGDYILFTTDTAFPTSIDGGNWSCIYVDSIPASGIRGLNIFTNGSDSSDTVLYRVLTPETVAEAGGFFIEEIDSTMGSFSIISDAFENVTSDPDFNLPSPAPDDPPTFSVESIRRGFHGGGMPPTSITTTVGGIWKDTVSLLHDGSPESSVVLWRRRVAELPGLTPIALTATTARLAYGTAGVDADLDVEVTTGMQASSRTGANDFAIAQTVYQVGREMGDPGGSDGVVTLFSEGTEIDSVNVAGLGSDAVATAVATAFDDNTNFTAVASSSSVVVTNVATGQDNTPSIVVSAGSDVTDEVSGDTTPADLAATRTVDNDGAGTTSVNGTLGSYTIDVGSTQVDSGTLDDNETNVEAATRFATSINDSTTHWTATSANNVITVTSVADGEDDDVAINITPGEDADGTAATLDSTMTVLRAGSLPGIDLSSTTWSYYVINQEVRVDDDTVEMDSDNNLMVRRGLINDVQSWDDASNIAGPNLNDTANIEVAYFTEPFMSSARTSQAIVTINVLTTGTVTHSVTSRVQLSYQLEFSTDSGSTWTPAVSSFLFTLGNTTTGTDYQTVIPLNFSNMFDLTANTEYYLRLVRRIHVGGSLVTNPRNNVSNNFLANMLAIEELTA